MNKKDEALKMAIEALESLWKIIDDIDTLDDLCKENDKLFRELVYKKQRTRFEITGITTDGYKLTGGAIQACKEALAQPAQEPMTLEDASKNIDWKMAALRVGEDLAFNGPDGYYGFTAQQWLEWALNNTHPAPSWQGLSDDEVKRNATKLGYLWTENSEISFKMDGFLELFARAIEQALRERNCNDTK